MSQPDVAATTSAIFGPPPIIADLSHGPAGAQSLTVNLPGASDVIRSITINAVDPKGAAGGDGMSDAMTSDLATRVGRLEGAVMKMSGDIGSIQAEMKHVATKTWVLGGVVAVMLTVAAAGWWMVQQYLGPILRGLGH